MIFDTKQYVPLIYRSSRDFEALCRLLDMILTSTKYEIDTLINLYIPAKCPEDFLPLLAEHLGYKYNYNDKVIENRIIIDNFHKMIRNKGSETGIKLACALSLNSLDEYDIQSNLFDDIDANVDVSKIEVFFDYEEGRIIVLYPNEDQKLRKLIDWVRPVGMYCEELPFEKTKASADLAIYAYADVITDPYNKDAYSRVQWSELYDGIVSIDSIDGLPHTWQDASEYTWETISEFTWEDFLSINPTSNPIKVIYDANGGIFAAGAQVIVNTYTGHTITTMSSDLISFGINELIGWNNGLGDTYPPNSEQVITSNVNVRLKAEWKILQQHNFEFNRSDFSTYTNIRPLFLGTFWNVKVEYRANENSNWVTENIYKSVVSSTTASSYQYTFEETTGQYRISIGYETIRDSNNDLLDINTLCFNTDLYLNSYLIDWSGLDEITEDMFSGLVTSSVIYNNTILEKFVFPPCITELTLPNYFLSGCTKLNDITFPQVECKFIYYKHNGSYISKFLQYAGIDNYRMGTFTIPSNVTFIYDNYSGGAVDFLLYIGFANQIVLKCNVLSSDLNNNDPLVNIFTYTNSTYNINILSIEGNIRLYDFVGNDKLNILHIGQNCSLNDYNGHNLGVAAHNLLQIDTDDNGSTTVIPNNQISGGTLPQLMLGSAIATLGEYTICDMTGILDFTIPQKVTTIPKTCIQGNTELRFINFNDNPNIVIQGFHNLPNLESIEIPDCNTLSTCFYNCGNLNTVTFNNIINPDFQTMFVNCNSLTQLSLNESTMYQVDSNMLYNGNYSYLLWVPWGISYVRTNSSTTTIGSYAFSGCPASALSPYIKDSTTISTDLINYYNDVVLTSNITTIQPNAFDLTNIGKLIIHNSNLDMTNIGNSTNCTISIIRAPINSTAHLFAIQNSITFIPIDDIEDNIEGLITSNLGSNILS